ncbi:hypothetical protein BHE74_00045285 [Ensete ventricosum]|nr:hypothetical protein BHE74_00045285 [Ensete ventricosum]
MLRSFQTLVPENLARSCTDSLGPEHTGPANQVGETLTEHLARGALSRRTKRSRTREAWRLRGPDPLLRLKCGLNRVSVRVRSSRFAPLYVSRLPRLLFFPHRFLLLDSYPSSSNGVYRARPLRVPLAPGEGSALFSARISAGEEEAGVGARLRWPAAAHRQRPAHLRIEESLSGCVLFPPLSHVMFGHSLLVHQELLQRCLAVSCLLVK